MHRTTKVPKHSGTSGNKCYDCGILDQGVNGNGFYLLLYLIVLRTVLLFLVSPLYIYLPIQ